MKYIKSSDPIFPKNLLEITDPPTGIYVRGEILKKDELAVAIVGTREMTSYGEEVAYRFAYELARNGVTIVSGMAKGIDTIAHKGALDAKGRTIAVFASGVDIIYPKQNSLLALQIEKHGALISEFRPKTPPRPMHFLFRNRLITGLAKAVLVVEGRRKSGTLSTATHAANQGREVFAVPGPVNSELSDLPNYLIENGARMAKSREDILEFLKEM